MTTESAPVERATGPIPWINLGDTTYWNFNIEECEETLGGKFLGELCVAIRNDTWTDYPVAVFWLPSSEKYGSNYIGLHGSFGVDENIYYVDASSVADGEWAGRIAENGEIIFSRFRHDYRRSIDGTAVADGGRDYIRGFGKQIWLQIVGPDFVILEDKDERHSA